MEFRLKPGFLLGAASSATQIEGGELDHSWNDWFSQGRIKDGSDPARAADHYARWREDTELMAELGISVCRFGIEWARICPEEDRVDEAALSHYREEILFMKELGIQPLMTIHHFTNPMWFERKGGFARAENSRYFLKLVEITVDALGDLVSEYITINEPNVFATESYYFGDWPPGASSFKEAVRVMNNLTACHIKAYELIHARRRAMGFTDTMVSFANSMRVFAPKNPKNPLHRFSACLTRRVFQGALTTAMTLGKFSWPLKNMAGVESGEYLDFIAINYYSRSTVTRLGDGVREGSPKNDLGWEIYPEGIVTCAREHYQVLPRPIWITENGTCDNRDAFRSRYIYDHLSALSASDLPVQRYYHWSFTDNFEWLEGESARFGLVHVDYETQQRTVKDSGRFYAGLIKEHGVTGELYRDHVADQEYHA